MAIEAAGREPPAPELTPGSRSVWPRGISADAGSGKTHELMESLVERLRAEGELVRDRETRLHVDKVACITFTRNAAGELWSRAYRRLEEERDRAQLSGGDAAYWSDQLQRLAGARFSTLHSLANWIVRQAPLEAGGMVGDEFLEEEVCNEYMRAAAQEVERALSGRLPSRTVGTLLAHGPSGSPYKKGLADVLSELAFKALADGLTREEMLASVGGNFRPGPESSDVVSEKDWADYGRALVNAVADTMDGYRRLRGRRLDFAEVLVLARELMRRADFRERIGQLFRCVLLDEAQDTDPVQLEVIYHLSGATAPLTFPVDWSKATFGPKLAMVGDVKQAIYRWRSAEPRVFEQSLRQFAERESLYRMRANWRALPRLVAAYQALAEFCRDPRHFAKSRPKADPRPCRRLLAHSEDVSVRDQMRRGPAIVRLNVREYAEKLAGEERVAAGHCRTAEARGIAAFIHGLVAGELSPPGDMAVYEDAPDAAPTADGARLQRPVLHDGRPRFRHRDFMVLLRSGPFEQIELAFQRLGIPYILPDRTDLYRQPEVVDAVAPFRAILRPDDVEATVSLLRGPVFAVPDNEIVAMLRADGNLTLRRLPGARPPEWGERFAGDCRELLTLLAQLRSDIARRPIELLDRWIDGSNLKAIYASLPGGQSALANLGRLREIWCDRFAAGETLADLVLRAEEGLEGAVEDSEGDLYGGSSDAVRLMTVHKAKGLQARIVVVANMGKGVLDRVRMEPAAYARDRGIVARVPKLSDLNPSSEDIASGGFSAYADGESRDMDPPIADGYGASLRDGAMYEDERRLFYVALTRACDGLVLVSDMIHAYRKAPDAYVCWTNWAKWLAQTDLGRFDVFDFNVSRAVEAVSDWVAPPEVPPFPSRTGLPLRLPRTAGWQGRVLRFIAAKEAAVGGEAADPLQGEGDKAADPETFAASTEREGRIGLGVLVHKYLEEADLGQSHVDEGLLRRAACLMGLDPSAPEIEGVRRDLERLLRDRRYRSLIRSGEAFLREAAFLHWPEGADVGMRGAVDLVVVRDAQRRAADVVDYKYSRAEGRELAGYRAQVLAYAEALREAGWQVGEANLVFIRGKVVWVLA